MLKVYTSQYRYSGKNRLDVTVKSGDKCFAPTWNLLMNYKKGNVDEEQYTDIYLNLMRKSYKKNRNRWNEILNQDEVVFVCFCPKDTFCHRYILADIFVKLGAKYMGEIK